MTWRALALGVLLGLFVAGFTYFNDQVIRQTLFIGNHLPASVFGTGLVLLLVVNPLLRLLGNVFGSRESGVGSREEGEGASSRLPTAGDRLMLKPAEIGIILALGLAVCAWPGSNLFRYFTQMQVLPVYRLPTQASWLSTGVMSYVPGQSSLLAKGYVEDWDRLVESLRSASEEAEGASALRRVWDRLPEAAQRVVRGADGPISGRSISSADQDTLVRGLNAVIGDDSLFDERAFDDLPLHREAEELLAKRRSGEGWTSADVQMLNRHLIDAALRGVLREPPMGSGVLIQAAGADQAVLADLMTGRGGGGNDQGDAGIAGRRAAVARWLTASGEAVRDVPWGVWWPSIRLWGGAILLASAAALCLMVVVHPQWSQRELLPYPTAEFVHEMTRWRPGRYLPEIAGSKLFWLGAVPVMVMHLANGLHAYYPEFPGIQRDFGFEPFNTLFPNAFRVPGADRLFRLTVYPSVIGFGFFVATRVSLSIGLSLVFWTVLGAWLLASGASLNNEKTTIGSSGTSLRFGAYAAMTLMILYFGRRYYWQVLKGSVGLPRSPDTPGYAVWAARLFGAFAASSAYFLVRFGGMPPVMAVLFLGLFLMMLVVLARINAETGLFYAQPDWIMGTVLAGLFGVTGVGAEGLVVLLLASQMFAADPREGLTPYLANGLRLGDRVDHAGPRRLAPWLGGMMVAGFVVALVATLSLQYSRGVNLTDGFASVIPTASVDKASQALSDLSARGELESAARVRGWEHLAMARPHPGLLWYAGAGFVLVLVCAVARIHLAWWPIHPILFLVWGSYPANMFASSFLLAAAIKAAVTKIGGAKAYGDAKPLMIGLIAGDVLMIIVWAVVGTAYYFWTGLMPPAYRILPI